MNRLSQVLDLILSHYSSGKPMNIEIRVFYKQDLPNYHLAFSSSPSKKDELEPCQSGDFTFNSSSFMDNSLTNHKIGEKDNRYVKCHGKVAFDWVLDSCHD